MLKLTKSFDIAMRILLRLADENRRMNGRKISQELCLPFNPVAKILQVLSRGGYVKTIRGKGGGVELSKPADKIFINDVIQSIEGPIYLMECTVNKKACSLSSECKVSLKIREIQENVISAFRSTSIADLKT